MVRFERNPVRRAGHVMTVADEPMLCSLFREAGILWFKPSETVTVHPGARDKIAGIGFTGGRIFPGPEVLENFMAVVAMWDWLRQEVDAPVKLRYLYRPAEVQAVANPTAPDSDHIYALAADGEFSTVEHRDHALNVMRAIKSREPWLRISLGWKRDSKIMHAGLLTDRGAREWEY
jgi:hypothetical protein